MSVSEIAEIPKKTLLTKELFHEIWQVYLRKGMTKLTEKEVLEIINESRDNDSRPTSED